MSCNGYSHLVVVANIPRTHASRTSNPTIDLTTCANPCRYSLFFVNDAEISISDAKSNRIKTLFSVGDKRSNLFAGFILILLASSHSISFRRKSPICSPLSMVFWFERPFASNLTTVVASESLTPVDCFGILWLRVENSYKCHSYRVTLWFIQRVRGEAITVAEHSDMYATESSFHHVRSVVSSVPVNHRSKRNKLLVQPWKRQRQMNAGLVAVPPYPVSNDASEYILCLFHALCLFHTFPRSDSRAFLLFYPEYLSFILLCPPFWTILCPSDPQFVASFSVLTAWHIFCSYHHHFLENSLIELLACVSLPAFSSNGKPVDVPHETKHAVHPCTLFPLALARSCRYFGISAKKFDGFFVWRCPPSVIIISLHNPIHRDTVDIHASTTNAQQLNIINMWKCRCNSSLSSRDTPSHLISPIRWIVCIRNRA